MKLAQILLACVTSCLVTTSVSAQGFCVAESGGCRDAQTGKLYVPDGNKLVDPETKQAYLENQPVEINSSKLNMPQSSGNVMPEGARDPRTGRIIQTGKQLGVQETEKSTETVNVPGRRVPISGGLVITTEGDVAITGGTAWIPPSTEKKVIERTYSRTTTCSDLKSEIEGLHRKWSTLEKWNRDDVGKRIDKFEAEYQAQCR